MNSMIYFLTYEGGPIKIGVSKNIYNRVRTLQSGFPKELKILGCMLGGVKKEKELHKQFNEIRDRGEWFSAHQSLLDFISENAVDPRDLSLIPERLDMNVDKFLNVSDVIELVGCSRTYIYEEIKRKKLNPFKIGRNLKFKQNEILKWIEDKKAS